MRLLYEPLTDIPLGFKEVEYLQSSGTQYIDLGFVVDSNKKVELGFSAASNQEAKVPTGVYDGTNWTYIVYTFGSNGLVTFNNSTSNTLGSFNTSKHDVSVDYKNLTYTYDGVSNTLSGTPRDYTLNLILFGRNNRGTPDAFFNGLKVYYLRAYDNGVLIRDMVPCLDTFSVPCMYDKVEGKTYYNLGTGDFTYGHTIKPVEYLESSGTQYIDTGYKPTNTTGHYMIMSYNTVNNSVPFGTMVSGNGVVGPYYASTSSNTGWWTRWGSTEPYASFTVTANTKYSVYINYNNDRVSRVDNTILSNNLPSFTEGAYGNLTLFRRNYSAAYAYFTGKIYCYQMTDGTNLVRDMIPVKDENGVGYMFDKITHTLFANAGTGSFVVGSELKKKKLRLIHDSNMRVPKGFKEVEYIQSSGTQYIDTEFIPTGNTGIDIRFLITGRGTGGNDSNIIMVGGDSAGYRCGFGYRSSSDTTYGHTLQVSGICATGNSWENYAMSSGNPHTVLYNYDNQKKCYLDGVLKRENIPYGTATVTYSMFIFSSNMNGTSWRTSSFKLYYCKIVDNGVLVRDYIPCLDSSNVPCLWDRITKKAYYNKGTGDFTYGSIIKPVKYLESTGTQYINTGVTLTNNHSVEVDYQLTSASQNKKGIFGGLTTSRYGALLSPSNNYLEFGYGSSNIWYQTGLPDTNRHTMYQKKNELYFDGVLIYTFNTATFTQTATAPLGNFNYTNYNPASAKYYSSKWWDGDTLVRDYIPVKDENNVGYMFDIVSHSLYANVGTGSFVVGQELNNKVRFIDDEIPSIYRRVNYLKASGAQYIDTGIDGKSGLRAKMAFEWGTEDIGNDRYVLAAAHAYYGRCYMGTYQSKWMYGYSSYWQAGTPEANTYYDAEVSWELNNQYLKINGETLITQTLSSSLNVQNTLYMFARHQDNPGWYSYAKIYYCQIWENGVMVRNYVPVVRKSDNKPGMYDRITKQFYVNDRAGVADFTYG